MSHLIFLLDFPKFSVQEAAGFPALFQQLRFHLPSILSHGREMIDISVYTLATNTRNSFCVETLVCTSHHTSISQYRRLEQYFKVQAEIRLEVLWYSRCVQYNRQLQRNIMEIHFNTERAAANYSPTFEAVSGLFSSTLNLLFHRLVPLWQAKC